MVVKWYLSCVVLFQVSRAGVVSPVTQLVVNILHELIAAPYSHTLLTLTPPALLPNLVPLLSPPDAFTYVELLAITAPKAPSQPELAREFLGDAIGAQTPAQAAGARRAAAKLLCVQRNLSLASESALYPIIIWVTCEGVAEASADGAQWCAHVHRIP